MSDPGDDALDYLMSDLTTTGRQQALETFERARAESRAARIRDAGESLYVLVYAAWRERDWLTLGYASWQAYIDEELHLSRGYSYQLLAQAKQVEAADLRNRNTLSDRSDTESNLTVQQAIELQRDENESARKAVPPDVGRVAPKSRKRPRSGPPGLVGHLQSIERSMELLADSLETAGDDAVDYLDYEQRRQLERTVSRMSEFSSEWAARLNPNTRFLRAL